MIGLPGDEVVIEGGQVSINGVTLDEPYIADHPAVSRPLAGSGRPVVRAGR